ncbi:MAG: hypothetical protein M3Z20_07280 [Chloroflexota bacterium]|nr:hypothetical protein [Chloroflexota bacterium]
MAGKYEPLAEHLESQVANEITMSFADVEALVGKLPQSAHEHRAWWANSTSQVEAKDGWLSVAWEVGDVDQAKGVVTFRRR